MVAPMTAQIAVGVSLLVLSSFTAMISVRRADNLLTGDQRRQVSEFLATPDTTWARVVICSLLLIALLVSTLAFRSSVMRLIILVPVTTGVLVYAHLSHFRGLRQLNLPPGYVRARLRGQTIGYAGFVAFVAVLTFRLWRWW